MTHPNIEIKDILMTGSINGRSYQYNDRPCLEYDQLWHALHSTFNKAQDRLIDFSLLDEIPNKQSSSWFPFSEAEFVNSIAKYNNSSTPGSDKLSWRHLKIIVKDSVCLKNIINIADVF